MAKTKVAITLDADLLGRIDQLVVEHRYPNRSRAIEAAVADKLARVHRLRLVRACAALDPEEERALAEEGMTTELAAWPEY